MKKKSVGLLLLSLVLVMCLFITVPASAASKVKLNTKSISLNVGDKSTLTLKNASGTVEWTVSKKNIVTISGEGTSVTIKGKKAGSTYVKATYNGKTYKCKVTVTANENDLEGINYSLTYYDCATMKDITRVGKYIGETKKGIPNGEGSFYTQNVDGIDYVISGTFKNGKLDGTYYFTFSDGVNEKYECKNGKFIKATFNYIDGEIEEYILKDKILYNNCVLNDNDRYLDHYIEGKLEKYTIIDWLYSMHFSDSYSGFSLSIDSAINMDTIRRLSDTKIKEKAKYIEAKKIKKSISSYTNSVDYLKKAYVVQCDEFNAHESWGLKPITEMILSYDGYIYVVWYEGSIDIYEGDYVSCWFTPFANISYENISRTTTKATCGVAYIIKATK